MVPIILETSIENIFGQVNDREKDCGNYREEKKTKKTKRHAKNCGSGDPWFPVELPSGLGWVFFFKKKSVIIHKIYLK